MLPLHATDGRAQFGGAALAGARTLSATEFLDDTPQMGLGREATYCWGTCRNAAGELFIHARRMAGPAGTAGGGASGGTGVQRSMSDRFLLQSTLDGALHPRLRREGALTAATDTVLRHIEDGRAAFAIPAEGDRGAMRLIAGDDVVSYAEGDILELSGDRIGPGLHWYLPYGPAALYYTSATWTVAGSILGEPVEGFLFLEEAFMPEGGRLYMHHDPLGHVGYQLWYSWASRWDDGTTEFGHFLANDGAFSVGLIANAEGSVQVARSVDAHVYRDDSGYWFERISLDVDGESWEILADEQGRMADLGPIPNPQQEALVRRVGEQRTPVMWMAWGESVPAHDPESHVPADRVE